VSSVSGHIANLADRVSTEQSSVYSLHKDDEQANLPRKILTGNSISRNATDPQSQNLMVRFGRFSFANSCSLQVVQSPFATLVSCCGQTKNSKGWAAKNDQTFVFHVFTCERAASLLNCRTKVVKWPEFFKQVSLFYIVTIALSVYCFMAGPFPFSNRSTNQHLIPNVLFSLKSTREQTKRCGTFVFEVYCNRPGKYDFLRSCMQSWKKNYTI